MEIIKNNQNYLFKRKDIEVSFESEKNPTINEAKEIISKEFKTDLDLIVISHIFGAYGSNKFKIIGKIYETIEEKKKIEPRSKKEEEAEKKENEENKAVTEEKKE